MSGWVDQVVLPTWGTARTFLLPGATLWSLYEISGRYNNDPPEKKTEMALARSELMAAGLSAFVVVALVGGSAWWLARRQRR